MAHGRFLPVLAVLLAGALMLKTDAARLMHKTTFHASSVMASRWTLLLTSRTDRHHMKLTSQPSRNQQLRGASSFGEPQPAPQHESIGSTPKSSPQPQPPVYSYAISSQLEQRLRDVELQHQQTLRAKPAAPAELLVELAAGVSFQARSGNEGDSAGDVATRPAGAAATRHSFDTAAEAAADGAGAAAGSSGSGVCSRMTALLSANLSVAAERAGGHFLEPLTVESCGGSMFRIRGSLRIPTAACSGFSSALYRELPRWVNAALGRPTGPVAECGEGDGQFLTTAWVYGNGDSLSTGGCVALAYPHMC